MMTSADAIHAFQLQRAGVRGQVVRLESAWHEIRQQAELPPVVARLLGESLVASAMFAGALKFEGSLSIHLRHAGALRLLFAECTHDGFLRGLARCEADASDASVVLAGTDTQLAITIENSRADARYQGLVAVESASLAQAFEGYFGQSEQLPTRIVFAAGNGRCAGLMVQQIAASGGSGSTIDEDAWGRVGHLLATLTEGELLDLPVEQLLVRLFHEEEILLQQGRPLAFRCSCSPQRVAAMLRSLGPSEADEALRAEGVLTVTCEFCNRRYQLDAIDLATVFSDSSPMPGPMTEQ